MFVQTILQSLYVQINWWHHSFCVLCKAKFYQFIILLLTNKHHFFFFILWLKGGLEPDQERKGIKLSFYMLDKSLIKRLKKLPFWWINMDRFGTNLPFQQFLHRKVGMLAIHLWVSNSQFWPKIKKEKVKTTIPKKKSYYYAWKIVFFFLLLAAKWNPKPVN